MSKKKKPRVPYNPAVDTGEKIPVRVRVIPKDAYDKYSEYPSNGLNPRRLAAIFREANEGNVYRQMELFEELEEKDTHLFSQLQTRKLAVTGLEWDIQPYSEEPIDEEIANFIEEQMKDFDILNDVFMDALDAISKGISILELAWGIDNKGRNVIDDIRWVHPKRLIWDNETDEMLICTKEHPSGVALPQNKFIVHKYKAKSGHPSRAGVMRIVSWMYLFKNFDIKDWVAFCEVFGMPLRLGKYDPSASEDDKLALEEAIFSLGSDAAGIVPTSTDIEFIEAQKTSSTDIYERFARFADEQISKAILGQTLTSDSGGSYAQGKVHSDVKKELTKADAKALATTFRRDVITPLVYYNYGSTANIPLFTFEIEDDDDLKETAETYKTLYEMGLDIPVSHIRRKFSIPAPKEGEEILKQVSQATPSAYEQVVQPLSLKVGAETEEQRQLDGMMKTMSKASGAMFGEMIKPLIGVLEKSEDLETALASLKDKETLKKIYQEMEQPEFEDLLQQGLYLATLMGREMQ